MKLIVNQAYENMGLASTQLLGPILDGLMRNTPDAEQFTRSPRSEASKPPSPSVMAFSATTARGPRKHGPVLST